MKDTTVTVRMPRALRRRIEAAARKEGRSLSAQIERLVESGLEGRGVSASPPPGKLAGAFADGLVPTLDDFREVRSALSRSLDRRTSR